MFKISRDVYVHDVEVGIMEVSYHVLGCSIVYTKSMSDEVTRLDLPIEVADTLYDLMTLARPTHDGGRNY